MEKNKDNTLCPINCPFLANRSFMPDVLPFYCDKFSVFLGVDAANKVQKCHLCLGIQQNIIQTGLSLLEAQLIPRGTIAELKKAFLDMPPIQQKNFVRILSQIGIQLKPNPYDKITPFWLMRQIQKGWMSAKKREESPEVQDFIKLLSVVGGGSPIDGMTKTLLSNLFQVLDGSEQAMLIAVLENPQNLKSFLKRFEKTPRDSDLLKNFRALLYEAHDQLQVAQMQAEQSAEMRQKIQPHVVAPRTITGGRDKMRHVLQKMTEVRASKTRN